jgi:hypothetical protein
LATGDGDDSLFLFLGCAIVDDQPDRPVSFAHDFWRVTENREQQSVQIQTIRTARGDIENHGEIAKTLSGLSSEIAGQAWAQVITAAGFEVVSRDLP